MHLISAVTLLMVNLITCSGLLLTVLRMPTGSGIMLSALWELTNVTCGNNTAGIYRHDYLDNPDFNCILDLYLYFNGNFIKYLSPTSLRMHEILPTFPGYSIREHTNTTDHFYVGTSDNYEYLWLNGNNGTLYAAVYFKTGDKESPVFIFSLPGIPYTVGQQPANFSEGDRYPELTVKLGIQDYCGTPNSTSVPTRACPAAPSVDMAEKTEYVRIGDDVWVECSVGTLEVIFDVTWKFNDLIGSNVEIDQTTNSAKYVGGTVLNPSLRINNFQPSDEGLYTCQTRNLFGWRIGQKLQVLLIREVPTVSVTPISLTVNQSESVILSCSVSGYPASNSIYWGKSVNGSNQATSGVITGDGVTSSILTIRSADVSDSGNYTCFAENSIGIANGSVIQVTVLAVDIKCPCSCTTTSNINVYANYTTAELYDILAPALRKLEELLKVNKKDLSSYINKHTSAPDGRMSSRSLGIGGVIFLCLVVASIVMMDISSLFSSHCKGQMHKTKIKR